MSYHMLLYHMEKSVLLGTKPLVDSIRHFIRVFSVVSFRSMTSRFPPFAFVEQPRSQGPLSSSLEGGKERTLGTRLFVKVIPLFCTAQSLLRILHWKHRETSRNLSKMAAVRPRDKRGCFRKRAERKPSVRHAMYTALLDRLAVVNRHDTSNWMVSLDSLNVSKIWDCRSFSDIKTLTGCRSFSHSEDFNSIL